MNSWQDEWLDLALQEDIGEGDHSGASCIPSDARSKAYLLVKEHGVLAGMEEAAIIFHRVDPQLAVDARISDGSVVQPGDVVLEVSGKSLSIVKAERLVLNIMQRMSGIATITRKVVDAIGSNKTKVLDTRKTTPGMRHLEKKAVRLGGGVNHRMGLYDMIMVKDNHIDYAGGIQAAWNKVMAYKKSHNLTVPVEFEARNMTEVKEILAAGAVDRIMLDNFSPVEITEALKVIDGRCETEASGGITIDTVKAYAATGVDFVSMGALTHSVKSLDLSLKASL